jgi:MYXO-CTERM domain-containing protein
MPLRTPWWSALCVAAIVAGAPARAAACSGPYCVNAEFFPGRGSVPANLPAVLYWPPSHWNDDGDAGPDPVRSGDVRFVRLDAAGPVDVAFALVPSDEPSTRSWAGSHGAPAYRLVPASELQVGARYAVWARDCNGTLASEPPRQPYTGPVADDEEDFDGTPAPRAPWAVFEVTEAATLPTALGKLTVSAPRQHDVQLGGGSGCYELFDAATVRAEVERAGDPFYDAIAFSTYVDGELYRPSPHLNYSPAYGDSWIGHGQDELAAVCDSGWRYPLELGAHSVRFEGRVAGTDVTLVSESVPFELACAAVADGGSAADGGSPSLDGGAHARDAAAPADASAAPTLHRPNPDEEATPQLIDRGPNMGETGIDGCSCRTAGDARGNALAVLLALVFVRRRRSRG